MDERIERLQAMANDLGQTWDLSVHDEEAIQFALDQIAELRTLNSSLVEGIKKIKRLASIDFADGLDVCAAALWDIDKVADELSELLATQNKA